MPGNGEECTIILGGNALLLSCYSLQDFGDDSISENETDDDNMDVGEEAASESEVEEENDAGNNEEWTSSSDARTDCSDEELDVTTAEAALKKLVPYNLEELEKVSSS